MSSDVPVSAILLAKSSNNTRGNEDKRLMYAGEYRPFCRSLVILWRFWDVGSTKYRTGTSGMGCLAEPICLIWSALLSHLIYTMSITYICIVTPHVRKLSRSVAVRFFNFVVQLTRSPIAGRFVSYRSIWYL